VTTLVALNGLANVDHVKRDLATGLLHVVEWADENSGGVCGGRG
jgi:hypothetical protein